MAHTGLARAELQDGEEKIAEGAAARVQLEAELMALGAAHQALKEQVATAEGDLAATKSALQTAQDRCDAAEVLFCCGPLSGVVIA